MVVIDPYRPLRRNEIIGAEESFRESGPVAPGRAAYS
jgi:hypothetical protein